MNLPRVLVDSTATLLMGPSISPGSCPHALTAAWELSPADFACSSAGDSQQGRIWWWCVQWCRLDQFAGIWPWLILWSHGLPTGSERQHVRIEIMENLWGSKKFRYISVVEQKFTEYLSEYMFYQQKPMQIFMDHTNMWVQIQQHLLIL